MNLAHKIRLVPKKNEIEYLKKSCGTARFVYNWALAKWKEDHKEEKKLTALKLKKEFNQIKREEYPWVYEVTKTASEQSFTNVGNAFNRFFSKQAGYPQFKKKGKSKDSFYIANDKLQIDGKKVRIPKLGWVKMREELRFSGKITSATVSRTADKWFISISVETDEKLKPIENQDRVGVDLGVKQLATFSNGQSVEGPKPFRKLLKKLRRLSKKLSKKKLGSKNREKAKKKLACLHYKISCLRQDALHKLTHHLTSNFGRVGIENLNVQGMMKNKKLAKSIADMGFFEFRRQLDYKAVLTQSQIVIVSRFFPSSKLCSQCNNKKDNLELSDRIYNCDSCGLTLDRDLNAAINILQEAFPT